MSDFECRNGHLMRGTTCDICGGTAYKMDGMTGKQWAKMEAEEQTCDEYWGKRNRDVEDYDE